VRPLLRLLRLLIVCRQIHECEGLVEHAENAGDRVDVVIAARAAVIDDVATNAPEQ
jgi:hypothetical protein